jgi:hypothetical protein
MSRPPIPFKSTDGQLESDPFRRAASPTPLPADRPYAQTGPESLAIHDILGSQEALEAFHAESELPRDLKQPPTRSRQGSLGIALAVVVVTGILGLTYLALKRPPSAVLTMPAAGNVAPVTTGLAQFDSRPSGAEVVIDGVLRGRTPLKLSLPVGSHALEIRADAGTRSLPLTIEAGTLVSQYVELSANLEGSTGRLDVSSDPTGAQVKVDGIAKGVTPLTLDTVEPGEHSVSLSRNGVNIVRTVKVSPGATASVMASLGAAATAGAVGGWIALSAPFELQVFEDGRLIGTTTTDRLMVPAGRHQLELVSGAFQFRQALSLDVQAGKVAAATVTVPNGSLSVNALPWADVWVDGRSAGTTPLANLTVPIGSHEIVLRHPQLGERRRTVTITTQSTVRLGVDFAQ